MELMADFRNAEMDRLGHISRDVQTMSSRHLSHRNGYQILALTVLLKAFQYTFPFRLKWARAILVVLLMDSPASDDQKDQMPSCPNICGTCNPSKLLVSRKAYCSRILSSICRLYISVYSARSNLSRERVLLFERLTLHDGNGLDPGDSRG